MNQLKKMANTILGNRIPSECEHSHDDDKRRKRAFLDDLDSLEWSLGQFSDMHKKRPIRDFDKVNDYFVMFDSWRQNLEQYRKCYFHNRLSVKVDSLENTLKKTLEINMRTYGQSFLSPSSGPRSASVLHRPESVNVGISEPSTRSFLYTDAASRSSTPSLSLSGAWAKKRAEDIEMKEFAAGSVNLLDMMYTRDFTEAKQTRSASSSGGPAIKPPAITKGMRQQIGGVGSLTGSSSGGTGSVKAIADRYQSMQHSSGRPLTRYPGHAVHVTHSGLNTRVDASSEKRSRDAKDDFGFRVNREKEVKTYGRTSGVATKTTVKNGESCAIPIEEGFAGSKAPTVHGTYARSGSQERNGSRPGKEDDASRTAGSVVSDHGVRKTAPGAAVTCAHSLTGLPELPMSSSAVDKERYETRPTTAARSGGLERRGSRSETSGSKDSQTQTEVSEKAVKSSSATDQRRCETKSGAAVRSASRERRRSRLESDYLREVEKDASSSALKTGSPGGPQIAPGSRITFASSLKPAQDEPSSAGEDLLERSYKTKSRTNMPSPYAQERRGSWIETKLENRLTPTPPAPGADDNGNHLERSDNTLTNQHGTHSATVDSNRNSGCGGLTQETSKDYSKLPVNQALQNSPGNSPFDGKPVRQENAQVQRSRELDLGGGGDSSSSSRTRPQVETAVQDASKSTNVPTVGFHPVHGYVRVYPNGQFRKLTREEIETLRESSQFNGDPDLRDNAGLRRSRELVSKEGSGDGVQHRSSSSAGTQPQIETSRESVPTNNLEGRVVFHPDHGHFVYHNGQYHKLTQEEYQDYQSLASNSRTPPPQQQTETHLSSRGRRGRNRQTPLESYSSAASGRPQTADRSRQAQPTAEIEEGVEVAEEARSFHDPTSEIYDIGQHIDLSNLKNHPNKNSSEFVQAVKAKAQTFEKDLSGTEPIDFVLYFIIDENLMQMIEFLDKMKVKDQRELLREKLDVIKYIQGLHAVLDTKMPS